MPRRGNVRMRWRRSALRMRRRHRCAAYLCCVHRRANADAWLPPGEGSAPFVSALGSHALSPTTLVPPTPSASCPRLQLPEFNNPKPNVDSPKALAQSELCKRKNNHAREQRNQQRKASSAKATVQRQQCKAVRTKSQPKTTPQRH